MSWETEHTSFCCIVLCAFLLLKCPHILREEVLHWVAEVALLQLRKGIIKVTVQDSCSVEGKNGWAYSNISRKLQITSNGYQRIW